MTGNLLPSAACPQIPSHAPDRVRQSRDSAASEGVRGLLGRHGRSGVTEPRRDTTGRRVVAGAVVTGPEVVAADPRWHSTSHRPATSDPVPGTYRVCEPTESGLLITHYREAA